MQKIVKSIFLTFILIYMSISFADKICMSLVMELKAKADSPVRAGVLSRSGFFQQKRI